MEVNGKRLTSRHIVIATGARPRVPALPGLDRVPYLTSDTIWLRLRGPAICWCWGGPHRLRAGPGLALLGIPVTLVEQGPQLLPGR